MIRVAIRFDDPSATSDRALEEGVINELARAGLCATLAVVPFKETDSGKVVLDSNRGSHLLAAHRARHIEIALHGHSHLRAQAEGEPSEFKGVEPSRQAELIAQATHHLREMFGDSAIAGFVPPWNSYDANTLVALGKLGFEYLSASWWFPPGHRGEVSIIPRTCQLSELRAAIAQARRYARLQPSIIAVMHHYDFVKQPLGEPALCLHRFSDLLGWLARQADVEVLTLRDLARATARVRVCAAMSAHRFKERLHWRLQHRLPDKCLVEAPLWRILTARATNG